MSNYSGSKSVWLWAILVPILALSAARAGEKSGRLEPLDVYNLQVAGDPQISPDGNSVVYARQFSDIMTDRHYSNLWIINFEGAGHRALTSGNYGDASPRWSPDGTRLAYVSDRDGKAQIYVRWMDTGQTAKVTNLLNPPTEISWSPDGKLIAFCSLVEAEAPRLGALPKPPAGAKWADPPTLYDRLIYRFNGRGYLKPGFTQLFVVASDGGAPRQLTTGDFPHGDILFGGGGSAVWAPDGKCLIFSANLRADFEYNPLDNEVYDVSLADGKVRQLTHRKGPDNDPAISPDGKTIAYVGFDDRYQGHQTQHLYLMNRDGSNPRLATLNLDRDAQHPCWAPDGSGVFFLYDDQGDTKLGFYSLDGRVKELAGHIGSGLSSYGGGAPITVARDGRFAVPYNTPTDPGDLAVGRLSDPRLKVLTALNQQLLLEKKLGEVEEFWFNSSVDQRKIEGWIIKPPGFNPGKKYPLILEIHGGPHGSYGDHFDTIKQMYAARDFVVVYTNPRGSTSYGEEFSNLIYHAYPGDDFYDLNSAVDAMLAKGYVDADNLFVTGGSGGGVLTCWMVDRTTRFRAAASLFPVINWYSWVLTSDVPSYGTEYWFPGPPWANMEHYMKRSVISYVDKVTTPTLLMTGEEDYRTPIEEAEQFYTALKLRKVEAMLIRFPGEAHGVSGRPSHMVARINYVLDWFDKYEKR